jgi:hypothetical protein
MTPLEDVLVSLQAVVRAYLDGAPGPTVGKALADTIELTTAHMLAERAQKRLR